ncbi:MAG: hypothetical protein Q9187_009492, partial [Circinaria calcarea]
PLNSDNEKQAVTSEASTEVSTLKGSPEGSPKGTLKGKYKVTQDEKAQANVPETFSDLVAEYRKDKADHYKPELVEKLKKMKATGAAPMLNNCDTLERAKSTGELPGPALVPMGSAPPVPYFELSESTMEKHQAILGMSPPRSKQHPVHKRYESENMSEYSTTSSVRQKKLFSEVVTSPGKKGGKTSNIIDLTGDIENESEGEIGPSQAAAKAKGKGKARGKGKGKGKKGNGSGSNSGKEEDAWKVPAGEKMWGSSGER